MSFFGNSSRPDRPDLRTTASENGSTRPATEGATFLGEASQVLPPRTEPVSASPLSSYEPGGSTGVSRSSSSAQNQAPTPPERCTNVIASGAKWKGTLTVDDSVRVDGNFSGEIQSKGTVHVSEGAQIDAKIRASFVVIAGNFRGEIRCDQRVDLLPRSRVNGEVITKVLSVHEGALLDGRVQMTGSEVEATPRLSTRTSRAASSLEVESESPAPERRERATAAPNTNSVPSDS